MQHPETGGPVGQVKNWVFIVFLFLLLKGGDGYLVQTDTFWKGEVSPWLIITFWDLL
jgi:hypothetical protein